MKKKFNYDKQFGQVMKTRECVIRLKIIVYGKHWHNTNHIPFDVVYSFLHLNLQQVEKHIKYIEYAK